MITIGRYNSTAASVSEPSQKEIDASSTWVRTGLVSATYLHEAMCGSFTTKSIPFGHYAELAQKALMEMPGLSELARRMASEPIFVAGTEYGWQASDRGEYMELDEVKKRFGDL